MYINKEIINFLIAIPFNIFSTTYIYNYLFPGRIPLNIIRNTSLLSMIYFTWFINFCLLPYDPSSHTFNSSYNNLRPIVLNSSDNESTTDDETTEEEKTDDEIPVID